MDSVTVASWLATGIGGLGGIVGITTAFGKHDTRITAIESWKHEHEKTEDEFRSDMKARLDKIDLKLDRIEQNQSKS